MSFQKIKKSNREKTDCIDSIVVYAINSSDQYFKAVECEDFHSYHPQKINLSRYKARIKHDLCLKETLKNKKNWFVDTRAQLIIYYPQLTDTICLGTLPVISINHISYDMENRDLTFMIDSLYVEVVYKHRRMQ